MGLSPKNLIRYPRGAHGAFARTGGRITAIEFIDHRLNQRLLYMRRVVPLEHLDRLTVG